jgi:hypothetical protein
MPMTKNLGEIRSKIGSTAHCIFKLGFLDVAWHVSPEIERCLAGQSLIFLLVSH